MPHIDRIPFVSREIATVTLMAALYAVASSASGDAQQRAPSPAHVEFDIASVKRQKDAPERPLTSIDLNLWRATATGARGKLVH